MFPEVTRDDIFRLETERLWLRWPRAADASAFVRLAGDPEIALKTATIPYPYEKRHADEAILRMREQNARGEGLDLAITLKRQPNEAIGVVGLRGVIEPREPAFGFWLGRPFWGQGLTGEAASAFLDLVFGFTSLERIVSHVMPTNSLSLRLHEKLGFQRVGMSSCSAPARGGEVMAEFLELRRGAAHSVFGARRPKLTSS
jgi:RimJ/RimL family protein N-acetyltransferase